MLSAKRLSATRSPIVARCDLFSNQMVVLDPNGTFLSGPTLRHRRSVGRRQLAREVETMRTDLADRLKHIDAGLQHMRRRFPQLGDFASQITASIAITRDALRPFDAPHSTEALRLRKNRLAAALRTTLSCSAQIADAQVDELEKQGVMEWGK